MTAFPSPDYRPGVRWMPPTTGPVRHALVTARQAAVVTISGEVVPILTNWSQP